MHKKLCIGFVLALASYGMLFSQEPVRTSQNEGVEPLDHTPVFRINVVSRTTKAVNYRHHGGKTELAFAGTELMPQARGEAEVESRTGRIQIEAKLENIQPSRAFGPEYLTYVLWAITPEGRAENLGEIVPRDGKSSVRVSTDLQAFGLIVTAEPYFAVTRPSDLVVIENVVKPDTKGWEQPIDTKFDALERGQYVVSVNASQLPATNADPNTPTDLLEARNAVAIARAEGADKYARDTLAKAEDFLSRAEAYLSSKQNEKAISTVARGAVQSAEDARVLSIRKREEERQEAERRATEERATQARLEAEKARTEAQEAEEQRAQAERDKRAAEKARADAESMRQEAELAKSRAVAEQQAAQLQAQQAQMTAQQAEQARLRTQQEAAETRQRLLQQLNQVLETKETTRGLIMAMPDVLFDTDQYTLKADAKVRLAKVAGILLAYPDLNISVEGHTDNVGSSGYNQELSERRASSVREFLVQQGVHPANIQSHGFGMTQPRASNATATGRQLNRRVDVIVTGEAIGNAEARRSEEQGTPANEYPINRPTGSGSLQPTPAQPSTATPVITPPPR